MRHVGLGDLLERLERLRAQLARRGPLRPGAQEARSRSSRTSSASSPARQRRREGRAAQRRAALAGSRVPHGLRAVQGDRTVPEVVAALRRLDADPDVEVIIVARGGGDPQNLLGFSDERLVRAVAAASTSRRQRDRPRDRPSAARRGRRPARLDADGCRQARRARRRRGARARRAGARPPRHAPLRDAHARDRPHRAPARPAALADAGWIVDRRAEELTRWVARGSELIERCIEAVRARRPSCAATCAPSRRSRRSTAATRSCSAPTARALRGPRRRRRGLARHAHARRGRARGESPPARSPRDGGVGAAE